MKPQRTLKRGIEGAICNRPPCGCERQRAHSFEGEWPHPARYPVHLQCALRSRMGRRLPIAAPCGLPRHATFFGAPGWMASLRRGGGGESGKWWAGEPRHGKTLAAGHSSKMALARGDFAWRSERAIHRAETRIRSHSSDTATK